MKDKGFFERYGWLYFRYPYGKNNKRVLCSNLDGSINGFGSHIQRIEKDKIFIAILRNMKERDNQIVIKWPSFMASKILAILYVEDYAKPKMSAAFSVFQTMLESGVHAAKEQYQQLDKNQRDQYYFEKTVFELLATKLGENNENEKAKILRTLTSNDE